MPFIKGLFFGHEGIITEKVLEDVHSLTTRDDDVFLITYPRSGTTWTQHIMLALQHGPNRLGDMLKNRELHSHFPFLEMRHFISPNVNLDEVTSPRFLKTHLPPSLAPKEIFTKKPKCVFMFRKPKEVCKSYYNFHLHIPKYVQPQDMAQFVDWFTNGPINYGDYWQWCAAWFEFIRQNESRCFFMFYEDVLLDFHGKVTELSDFLGTSGGNIDDVEKVTAFYNMKQWIAVSNRKTASEKGNDNLNESLFQHFNDVTRERLSEISHIEKFLS
ncbi:sulfotransferase 1E1-like [Convolutriloba macropyga]|uniref:sulfotransferase 1E1-like n=1 Tax=Convolutriloba macropyga TaxID=536237 RepID=UPI003F51EAAD